MARRGSKIQDITATAIAALTICAMMKGGASIGRIPENVFVGAI